MPRDEISRHPTAFAVPFSKAVKAGGFLFLSGVLPMDAQARIVEGDIAVQTRVVLDSIAGTLRELGGGMEAVVRVTAWLSDLQDFTAFNEEYRRHFPGGLPARSTVRADLFQGAKVEIEIQAWIGK